MGPLVENSGLGISLIGLFVSFISLGLAIIAYRFSKKVRKNEIAPFLVYFNGFGGYLNKDKRIPKVIFTLKNTGSQAKIVSVTNNSISTKIFLEPSVIRSEEEFKIIVNATTPIKHGAIKHSFSISILDLDKNLYKQEFFGQGIFLQSRS